MDVHIEHYSQKVGTATVNLGHSAIFPCGAEFSGFVYRLRLRKSEYGPTPLLELARPLFKVAPYYVYVLYKNGTRVYVGATKNPLQRLAAHTASRGSVFMEILHTGNYAQIKALETKEIAAHRSMFRGLTNRAHESFYNETGAMEYPTVHSLETDHPDFSSLFTAQPKIPMAPGATIYDPTRDPANY